MNTPCNRRKIMLTVKASTNLSTTIKAETDVWCACKKQATTSTCWHKYCLCKLEVIIHKHKTNTMYLPILIPVVQHIFVH